MKRGDGERSSRKSHKRDEISLSGAVNAAAWNIIINSFAERRRFVKYINSLFTFNYGGEP
jgi:hypothetical protein